jgi:hypothetical protein
MGPVRIRAKYAAIVFLPAFALASQSLRSGSGTAHLPNSAPWTNLATWRAEFRLHDFHYNGAYQLVFGSRSYALRIAPANAVLLTSWRDNSAVCQVDLPGRTDVLFRFQRDAANSRLTAEAWNAADGSGYFQAICPLSVVGVANDGDSEIGVGDLKGSLAYLRLYHSVVPLGTAPGNRSGGDLLDYEFEDGGKDLAHRINLHMSGATYSSTPAYPPAAVFGQYPASRTFATGPRGIALDGSSSFTAMDDATLSYAWTQVSGPSSGAFSDPGAALTRFAASVPGTYVLQLTVTDQLGKSGSRKIKYGAVPVGADGLIQVPNTAVSRVLGPLSISGSSPWPWYDVTERADADALMPYQTAYPAAGTRLTGTVTVALTNGNIYVPPTVSGNATRFTTELKIGDGIAFVWRAPDGLDGQWRATVTGIADDTHLSVDNAGNPRPFPFSNVTAYRIARSDYTFWGDNQGVATNWNYYDDVLALYRLYYRTGIDDYLNAARTLADGWYHYALDHGYGILYPRNAALQGLILRALDGRPEYWKGILYYMDYPLGWSEQFRQTTPLPANSRIEPRETGYVLRWGAFIAEVSPAAAVRAKWCSAIANAVTNVWPFVQDDIGNFEEDVYNENPTYPYKGYDRRFGSSPWRATIALLGLQQAYDALHNPSACNNPSAAAKALTVSTRFIDFVHDYGTGSNGGQLYSVGYETLGQDPLAARGFNNSLPNTSGTLSVTPGSTTVTGSGTNFTTIFWKVPGAVRGVAPTISGNPVNKPTDYIGIPGANDCHLVFKVVSVVSDTQLTLAEPWPSRCKAQTGVTSSVGWVATWEGERKCSSKAAYCEGGPSGDRNLTHDIHAAYAWTWQTTGIAKYRDWAIASLAVDYGGPAGGPGTRGRGAGPSADGSTGNFADPLPVCGTPPCGGFGATAAMGKAFGMSTGAGNAPNAIAIITPSFDRRDGTRQK